MLNKTCPYKDGWLAHNNDIDVDDNPYNEKSQQFSHEQWKHGWCARFSVIKHGDEIEENDNTILD